MQLGAITHSTLLGPFADRVVECAAGSWVDYTGYEHLPAFFWKQALKGVVHALGVGQVGDKAIGQLVERLRAGGKRDGWIPLRKESRTMVLNNRIIFFKPSFFPYVLELKPNSKHASPVFHPHVPEGAQLCVGQQWFGPWCVELSPVCTSK